MDPRGFRDMVRKAQAGDAQARDELFRRALPFIEQVVHARPLAPGESVSDRLQNVSERILVKLDQFRGAQEVPDDEQTWALFTGWVRQIVFTVGANAARDRDPLPKVPLTPAAGSTSTPGNDPPAPETTPSAHARGNEEAKLVLAALDNLPDPVNREIVRLRFFEGLSLREITGRLALTYDVVRERYKVSMRRMRRELEGLE
jgi:RNA polymerase sigma factor (sigma-70 family)